MFTLNRKPKPESPATPDQPKSISDLRAELELGQQSLAQLATRQADAASELAAATQGYDGELAAFSLGQSAGEPSRERLNAATDRVASLQRIHTSLAGMIPRLQSQLADAELSAAVAQGRDTIPALTASSNARIEKMKALAAEFRAEEALLFDDLFSVARGLRQKFATDELNRAAFQARFRLREALQVEVIDRFKLLVNPSFANDGNPNLGSDLPDTVNFYRAFGAGK